MREKILETQLIVLYYNTEAKEIEYIYYPTATDISEKKYLQEAIAATEEMEKREIVYAIIDFRDMSSPVTPEGQDEAVEKVVLRWIKMGIKKVALIMPTEFIANLSIEQMSDDIKEVESPFKQKFFGNHEKARGWLYK